ncbi:MAG: hypothetical protein QME35_01730 [Thermoanaerobacteraceae bacterium]|nr:hypothetical protein [Thermoanaerobacteraceae bacterium]
MKRNKVYLKNIEKEDKGALLLWLEDIDVVKFLIDMFKVSRGDDNVLNIPFGKNRKVFIIQTDKKINIGFCGVYNIDWQLKKCTIYIYIDNSKKINDDYVCDITNKIFKGKFMSETKFKIIEVRTKENRFIEYFENISNIWKDENDFVFEVGVDDKTG